MHEVITLQLGQRANYLATHFWNLQESYFTYSENEESLINHDIHFRSGVAADGTDTFTPRTVIYDLKGGFGSLRKYNALYELSDGSAPVRGLWDGSTLTQQQNVIEPTRYQMNLDLGLPTFQLKASDVRYWSDFNRVFYHPRSIVQLNEYELNSQLMPFENWSAGEELYQTLDKEFDLLDRDLRPFAEECDQLQGLQVIAGTDDAWGGFSSKYMDDLRDEFGKTSIWVWALEDTQTVTRQKKLARACNAARSLRSVGQQASAYIRMSTSPRDLPQYVNLDLSSEWSTSALLCSAMESFTIPTRIRANGGRQGSYDLLEATLNTTGNQTLFELHSSADEDDVHVVNGHANGASANGADNAALQLGEDVAPPPATFDISFAPDDDPSPRNVAGHTFAQVEAYRQPLRRQALSSETSPDVRMRQVRDDETVVERFDARIPLPRVDTFPDTLFSSRQGSSISIRTGLLSTSRTRIRVNSLRDLTRRGIDTEDREAMYNDLTEIANAYSHGWDSGSDSGEDS